MREGEAPGRQRHLARRDLGTLAEKTGVEQRAGGLPASGLIAEVEQADEVVGIVDAHEDQQVGILLAAQELDAARAQGRPLAPPVEKGADGVEHRARVAILEVDGAREVLGTIAGATIGVAGTTFSITVAALTLASTQMGPRLLRNFTRDAGNQYALG